MTTHPRDAIVETLHRWPGRGTGAAADLPVALPEETPQ